MARQKKEDSGAELMVSIDQFTRTRDSVIVSLTNLQAGLTHVQNGLNDLLRAYMQHTASILAGEDGDLDKLQLPANITATANAAMEAANNAANGVAQVLATPAVALAGDGKIKKRKREKKEKDPNAPKRPLTAAFLFAQAARPVVKQDLEAALAPDQKLEPNAVNLEVTKRWNEMPENEKEKWRQSYRDSMEQFKTQMEAYKAQGGATAPDLHDEEGSDDAEGEAEVGVVETDASDESEEEAPVAKAPSPPAKNARANKRQKTAQVNGAVPVPIAPAGASVPVPKQSQVPAPGESTPSGKKDKKKKAGPQAIAPAPANGAQDAAPEEAGKKKATKGRSTRNAEPDPEPEKEAKPAPKKRDRSKRKSEGASA